MFEGLNCLPADPILGLMGLFRDDPNPNKVDLGVGVYKDESGVTPVLDSIKVAEHRVIGSQTSKVYVGPAGNAQFNQSLSELLLGKDCAAISDGRLAVAQTPGGCGALRVAAELTSAAKPDAVIWVSDPTWGNHIPLLGRCGLSIRTYPYYDAETSTLNFEGMMEALSQVSAGDLVLLHGCCHNPSGVDLSQAQWRLLADLAERKGFTPFVDIAYQGFGDGLNEDAYGLRLLASRLPEVLFAASCSKNFGMYRERVGLVGLIAESDTASKAALTHMLSIIRGIYSMPPDHGAAVVAEVLTDKALFTQWEQEVADMRGRINGLRLQFSNEMKQRLGTNRFDFVKTQKGMFSFLGLTPEQVYTLQKSHSIYMLESSRASIAGLSQKTIARVCDAVAEVVK